MLNSLVVCHMWSFSSLPDYWTWFSTQTKRLGSRWETELTCHWNRRRYTKDVSLKIAFSRLLWKKYHSRQWILNGRLPLSRLETRWTPKVNIFTRKIRTWAHERVVCCKTKVFSFSCIYWSYKYVYNALKMRTWR